MADGWQIFRGKEGRVVEKPSVTIEATGRFVIDRPAWQILGTPSHILFCYDPEQHRIGLRAGTPNEAGAQRLRPQHDGTAFAAQGRPFLEHIGFQASQNVIAPVALEETTLVIHVEGTGAR